MERWAPSQTTSSYPCSLKLVAQETYLSMLLLPRKLRRKFLTVLTKLMLLKILTKQRPLKVLTKLRLQKVLTKLKLLEKECNSTRNAREILGYSKCKQKRISFVVSIPFDLVWCDDTRLASISLCLIKQIWSMHAWYSFDAKPPANFFCPTVIHVLFPGHFGSL
mmetsp:Transcript_19156/g.25979  ORF Transcript_19156/g.25979 Transcript_19156/m.25979 type:complete len:164 (-) Transcript_19156:204-695(-)